MLHAFAHLIRRNVLRIIFLLNAPVALFLSLSLPFESSIARYIPPLTSGPNDDGFVTVLVFWVLLSLAAVFALSRSRWDFLEVPNRTRALWIGLTLFGSTLLAYFLAAIPTLLLGYLLTANSQHPPERWILLTAVAFWMPLWWAPSLGAVMTGWRLGRLYRRA